MHIGLNRGLGAIAVNRPRFEGHGQDLLTAIEKSPEMAKKPVPDKSAELFAELAVPYLAVVQADGSRMQMDGVDVFALIQVLAKKNAAAQTQPTPQTGVFYHQMTGIFDGKECFRIVPKAEQWALTTLHGSTPPKDGWSKVKTGHDIRIALNKTIEALTALKFVEFKALLPWQAVPSGALTEFPVQASHAYLTVTPAGQTWLEQQLTSRGKQID